MKMSKLDKIPQKENDQIEIDSFDVTTQQLKDLFWNIQTQVDSEWAGDTSRCGHVRVTRTDLKPRPCNLIEDCNHGTMAIKIYLRFPIDISRKDELADPNIIPLPKHGMT